MVRFIIAVAVAILIVAMSWPYIRPYLPRRPQPGVAKGTSKDAFKPLSKGELIYFAVLITVALSFAISVMMWAFGR